MSRNLLRRALLVIPLGLATLAGCKDADPTAPKFRPSVPFAQGAGGVWTVNNLHDPGDGTCDDTDCTLREAVAAAAAGDQVVFANGLQGAIPLTSVILISRPLTIDGGGRIALDAQHSSRVIAIQNNNSAVPLLVTLDGLTLKNGTSTVDGGGLWISQSSTVTVRNSVITENSADFRAGGIFVQLFGSLTLINSTVDGNTATGITTGQSTGGGIHNDGTLVIGNSTISRNNAEDGGGIWNSATMTVVASTISGNTGRFGGGIYNDGGSVNLRSTTLTRNHARSLIAGGGIRNEAGVAQMANSIIAGNTTSSPSGIVPSNCLVVNSGTFTSLGYNVLEGCNSSATDVIITSAQLFTEVIEQDLKNNGGPTMTHALIARGHAVDAGRCPAETTDQRGFTRPVDDPTVPNALDACDIGAYEAQGPQVAVADLMVSQAVNKSSVKQGDLLTYTVRVQNLGPQTAPNVIMNNVLSSGVTFVEARQNKGTITAPPKGETGTVTWNIGDMANQANEVAEIVVTVLVRGKTTITNTASVSGDVADPNAANNSAAITVSVAPGSSGKKP